MSKRNYRDLWIGLKAVLLVNPKKRWSAREIYDAMHTIEINQQVHELRDEVDVEVLKHGTH